MILGKLIRAGHHYEFEHGSFHPLVRGNMDLVHSRVALRDMIWNGDLMPHNIRLSRIDRATFDDYELVLIDKLVSTWDAKVDEGLKSFVAMMDDLNTEVTEETITQLILPHLDDHIGESFYASSKVRKAVTQNISRSWKSGKTYAAQKVGMLAPEARFIDRKAQEYLTKDTRFWLRHRWDSHIRERIAQTAREVGIEQGLGRREVGRAMAAAFKGVCSENPYYWEVVGSAATQRAKTWSHYVTMQQMAFDESTWMTMGDERVCVICGPLDGTVFKVAKAIEQMEACMASEDPFEARNIAPWINWDSKKEKPYTNRYDKDGNITGRSYFASDKLKDGKYLQGKGISGPQAHAGCRCDLV